VWISFHVVDDETVVLPLDHPFVKEGRFASLLVRDRELAESLSEGFQELCGLSHIAAPGSRRGWDAASGSGKR
jgi:hypothetical protein